MDYVLDPEEKVKKLSEEMKEYIDLTFGWIQI